MKKLIGTTLMGIVMMGLVAPCLYAEPEEDSGAKTEQSEAKSLVGEALGKLKTFNAKPKKGAQFYIYLQSASWCGPCRAEMPNIAKEYKKIKKAGGEIILLGCDKTEADAKNYLKDFRAKFPGIMREKGSKLPGYVDAPGIPHATFVRPDGSVIKSGHGSIIMDWKEIIAEI